MRATGPTGSWTKFKTVTEQARSFSELEARFGGAANLIGAPEGDYNMPEPPEGMKGEWDKDDPLLQAFTPLAKEMNLSQEAFDKIVQMGAQVIGAQNEADEAALADALGNIGANANQRIAAVDQYLISEVGEEGWKSLQGALGTNVQAYLALEAVVAKASGDAQLAGGEGIGDAGFTMEEANEERFKKFPEGHALAGKTMYEHDKDSPRQGRLDV